ncbi:MAG TPA: NAD(P)-binding domain-containing protein [Aggregatilineales bacterium]|nr:NAD(P)-binding domain-containing protein [Aggregatilineales bacterium]
MKIGILGTGGVGQTFALKLTEIGHSVMIGTRDVSATLANTTPDGYGNPPFSAWHKANPAIQLGSFSQAAAHGEVIINATNGYGSIPALEVAGEANLNGKILMDISNPLDFSKGMPPSLFVSNTDSLAEQIQARFPSVKVVKTLNTLTSVLMVNPSALADGDHHIFVSGNDADAKNTVVGYLKTWFGWKHVIDLGDITTARGTEMLLPIWLRLWGSLGTGMFNFKVVQ